MLPWNEAKEIIRRRGLSVEPLTARFIERDDGTGPDCIIDLEWGGKQNRFAVEYKRSSTPKAIMAGISQAKLYARELRNSSPMIIAPYMSDEIIDRLQEEEVSGIDLSGNQVIIVPGEWLIVMKGNPNRFPASQTIKAAYAGTSSLVGRVLLSRHMYGMVKEVREEIMRRGGEVSLPTVSKVLKRMEEDLIISRVTDVRLLQPDRLLERIRTNYVAPAIRDRRSGIVGVGDEFQGALVENARRLNVRMAASSEQRYVISASTEPLRVYTTNIDALLEGLDFRAGRRFANIEFLETRDQRVYFDLWTVDEFPWTPPLQVYLELQAGGKREQQAAEQLKREILQEADE